jgi:hypothetical protein
MEVLLLILAANVVAMDVYARARQSILKFLLALKPATEFSWLDAVK